MVEFVSYDGRYPTLCMWTLVLKIDGVERVFPKYCMHSGGSAWIDNEGKDFVSIGDWVIDIPEDLEKYRDEIENCVNANVRYGCCGGCI